MYRTTTGKKLNLVTQKQSAVCSLVQFAICNLQEVPENLLYGGVLLDQEHCLG
jgi:hypothetical protein